MNTMSAFRSPQAGVGLVELMVTLLLGAMITAGVIALFNANRQSFRLQDNLSQAQESGSFAVDFIARDLRKAGYPAYGASSPFEPLSNFMVDTTVNDRVENLTEKINGADTAVTYVDDQLSIIYRTDEYSSGTACTGEAPPANTYFINNRYWVRSANGVRELVCQGFAYSDAGTLINAIGQPQALVSGVDSFQVLYGVDVTPDRNPETSGGGAGCPESPDMADLYVPGDQLQKAYDIGRSAATCDSDVPAGSVVRSVRIGLLLRTPADVDVPPDDDQVYTVLDRQLDKDNFAAINDGRIRRLFVTTVQLRNVNRVLE